MAEPTPETTANRPTLPKLDETLERHQRFDGDPAVADQLGKVMRNVRHAIDLTVAPDPDKPDMPIHRGREEKALALLTGMERLTEDPYGLGRVSRTTSPAEAERLASFIREVSKLGRVNEDDGSVTLYARPDNGANGPIKITPKGRNH